MVRLLDSKQAAAKLIVHPKTLQRWARLGLIPAIRIGKLWRFREEVLDAMGSKGLSFENHPYRESKG